MNIKQAKVSSVLLYTAFFLTYIIENRLCRG